jgi:hypothetical protein
VRQPLQGRAPRIHELPSKRRPRLTGTPVRPINLADGDLDPAIRRLIQDLRAKLGPYGWILHAKKVGQDLSFQFDNPLSGMSTGMHFQPNRPPAEIRQQLEDSMLEDPEFARTQLAVPPRRRRALIGALRYAATWYGWPRRVFEEVIEVLFHFHAISKGEWEWMKSVGPQAWSEQVERGVRKRQRAERRIKKSKPN